MMTSRLLDRSPPDDSWKAETLRLAPTLADYIRNFTQISNSTLAAVSQNATPSRGSAVKERKPSQSSSNTTTGPRSAFNRSLRRNHRTAPTRRRTEEERKESDIRRDTLPLKRNARTASRSKYNDHGGRLSKGLSNRAVCHATLRLSTLCLKPGPRVQRLRIQSSSLNLGLTSRGLPRQTMRQGLRVPRAMAKTINVSCSSHRWLTGGLLTFTNEQKTDSSEQRQASLDALVWICSTNVPSFNYLLPR